MDLVREISHTQLYFIQRAYLPVRLRNLKVHITLKKIYLKKKNHLVKKIESDFKSLKKCFFFSNML
jgi:hypothetical protein